MNAASKDKIQESFGFLVANAPGWLDTGVVAAAVRCGAVGILNCENTTNSSVIQEAIARLVKLARGPFGLLLDSQCTLTEEVLAELPAEAQWVILTSAESARLRHLTKLARASGNRRVLIQVTSHDQAAAAVESGAAALIAKGHEAGGWVGEESTFVLLQRLLSEFQLPVWAYGGIGLHSASACYAAGAAGVLLDSQLLLATESSLPSKFRAAVEGMDGDATLCLGRELGSCYRFYHRPGLPAADKLRRLQDELSTSKSKTTARTWMEAVRSRARWRQPETDVWPLGQDAVLAAPLARRFRNVSGIVSALSESIREHIETAKHQGILDRGSAFAQYHESEYPVLEALVLPAGDASFSVAEAAENGSAHFVALHTKRGPEVRKLLGRVKELQQSRWGAAISASAPSGLRQEQLEVLRELKPQFALIAGGGADEAASLEQAGIHCYLHVSSPELLRKLLADGIRGFIFEAPERTGEYGSLMLWEAMIEVLLDEIGRGRNAKELRIIFAGGIRDERAVAMIAAMAAPVAAKGAMIGVLLNASHLFSEEAVNNTGVGQDAGLKCNQVIVASIELYRRLPTPFSRADAGAVEEQPAPCDVAIVGMSCLLPKAPNVRAFWANVINNVDAITDIPKERFDVELYFDPDRKARDKIYSKWGGFLDDVPFDPIRYGIPPNALNSIDPRQLLSLVVVDRALEDAGYHDREFPRERTSAIFGLSGGLGDLGINYAVRSSLPQFLGKPPDELLDQLPEWTEDSFAGILLNVTTGRVANRFNLGGVNFTVDAACASSLAAVYLAARELTNRTSDAVIVGGVDTVQSPFGFLCFSKSQALSPRGRCGTFDAGADGIAISEGITVLVLKRLEDAERDGDRIYAVIKGVAGSSDGRGRSMTAPRLEGQVLALQRTYAQAGIAPSTVGLIEAHGTGTAAGDAAELAALSQVFRADGAAAQSCGIGSVKSMIGHTKSAAGVTGLMKVALALHHKVLPPTLHVQQPNAKLREEGNPFFVNADAQPWLASDSSPRRAGVSSFGFGGTNFHAVLEEYQGDLADPADRANVDQWPAELFLWNAPSVEALSASLDQMTSFLEHRASPVLRDLAISTCRLAGAPQQGGVRLAIVASSIEDLSGKVAKASKALRSGHDLEDPAGIYLVSKREGGAKIAFLFPGQGSQKPGMLRELALHFPEVRGSVERADDVLAGRFPKKLSTYIYPPTAFGAEEDRKQMQEITDTVIAQPALGAVEMGLVRLLARLGIEPDMTAGHSYGEYVALCAAGVLPDTALFDLSEKRGRAITESIQGDGGSMAAVPAGADAVVQALDGTPGITIANHNSPRQTVISGASDHVQAALAKLEATGVAGRRIPVACAFHSPLMQPARDRLAVALASQNFSSPRSAVFSNTLGKRYPEDPKQIAGVLADHLVKPVRFVEEILAMYEEGARIFVEVGPKGVLTGLTRQILEGREVHCMQLDGDRPGLVQLLHVLGRLALEGIELDSEQLFRGRAAQVLDLNQLSVPQPAQPGWLVNGSCAFSRSQRPPLKHPVDLVAAAEAQPVSRSEAAQPAMVPVPAPAVAPALSTPPANGDAVILQFQLLMGQFLQTQGAIMTSYLSGGSGVMPGPVLQMPLSAPAIPAATIPPHSAPQNGAPKPPEAPSVTAAVHAVAQRDCTAELRKIASEKTGYPIEMLDLDAGIEADLGIDSIKRVEILAAFQRLCTPAEQTMVQGIMEKLTSARTLREIAERLSGVLSEKVRVNGHKTPAVEIPQAAPAAHHDSTAELRKIASERTGYPLEMLDLDAGIEADLGIDSIKRVEILSAFQRSCTAPEQAKVQGIMDKLTGARTLREIGERLAATLSDKPATNGHNAQPAEAPRQAVALSQRDYTAELRKIASERTGYPVEMLDLDAGIEADLGIDSIKRVEILSAFQRICTAAEQNKLQGVMDKLTGSRTLRQVSEQIGSALRAEEAITAGGSESAENPKTLTRCVLTTVSKPRRQAEPHFYPGRVCLITDDETGIASGFAAELTRAGERPILLQHSPEGTTGGNGVYTTDLRKPAAIDSAVAAIRERFGPVGAVIHLLPLRRRPEQPSSLSEWREIVQLEVKSLYALARATEADLKQTGRSGGAMIAAITARGGDFGLRPDVSVLPAHHAVADFIKTLSLEFTGVLSKVVDLDPFDPVPILRQKLIDELASDDDTLQAGLPGDRRLTVMPQLAPLADGKHREISSDWVFLLTGGARGITAEIATMLARRHQPRLILAGTSPLPRPESGETAGITDAAQLKNILTARLRAANASVKPAEVEAAYQRLVKDREILHTLQLLRGYGTEVAYHAVDVRDESAFGGLIERIYRDYGRLDVVVHGAGIIEDKLIRDKTPESFDRVVHTKADSVFLLSRKLRPESLKCLVLMSSITAAFGNRAQSDYAAANGIMNGLSVALSSQWPCRVVAMNWGPWDPQSSGPRQAGMVSEETRQQFKVRGVQLIPAAAGAEAVLREIETGDSNDPLVTLGDGPWTEVALPAELDAQTAHALGGTS